MNVYELGSDVNKFVWVRCTHEDDLDFSMEHFRGEPMKNIWYPLEVEHLIENKKDRRLPAGDFPYFGGDPAFSRRATDSIRDILEANGEILPLKSKDGEYYAYNVTNTIDALDEEKSELKLHRDGSIMRVLQYVFHEDRIKNEQIFKIPQKIGLVFVTDAFVQRVQDEGLLGFKFPEVYPHTEDTWSFLKNKS